MARTTLKLIAAVAMLAGAWTAAKAADNAPAIRVTLLGSGTPTPRPDIFSMSTLVEAGDQKLVFDLGRGSTIRLYQKKIPLGAVTAHFITHLHSDHIVGLPDMWMTGWIGTPWGSRKTPMVVFGPRGTVAMTENLTRAFAEDIRIRTEDEHFPAAGIAFDATDIVAGPVYDKGGVKVTAFEVNHGEHIRPAYGYMVEYAGHKVVLSGDTRYDERVANAAKGADLLIHEVSVIEPELIQARPEYRAIADHHTSPEEAGRIFSIANPKLAVYSHIVFAGVKPIQDVPVEALTTRTESTYRGPFMIGADLMSFAIGDKVEAFGPDGAALKPLMAGQ
ncbi:MULTISPECIES: MBL fold metallo-hydrolase [unclassified Bradyrhizobium]|uniref:MBL fold metallo-hydrolase n=1 Tax=unclassified Bradyrhizobium TaxID=2631580 RepID=UPI0032E4CD8B